MRRATCAEPRMKTGGSVLREWGGREVTLCIARTQNDLWVVVGRRVLCGRLVTVQQHWPVVVGWLKAAKVIYPGALSK